MTLTLNGERIIKTSDATSEVPSGFTKVTATGLRYTLAKSQLNKIRLRPQIINEHVESSRNLVSTVTSTNIVGQIFKASQDNINGIEFTARAEQTFVIDDFESYADTAALQAAWIESNPARKALLETTVVYEGLQAMALDAGANVDDEWETTIASTDLTDVAGSLWIRQTSSYANMKLRFYIGDGTNTKSAPIVVQNTNVWQEITIPEFILTEDGGGTTNSAAITQVGFRLQDKLTGGTFYIDLMSATLTPGSIEIKLWNMGTSIPVSGATSIDDGTQYTKLGDAGITGVQDASITVDLISGFRQYHVDTFVAGPALEIPTNELLIPGNYYMLTFNYVDVDIEMYGSNPAWDNYYINGYSFTAPDEATAITATGADEDLQFIIYSTQVVFVDYFFQFMDAVPGSNSSVLMNIEDENMRITDVIIAGATGQQAIEQDLPKAHKMTKGSKFEFNYNDDYTDSVSFISFGFQYFYEPPEVNG